MKYKVEMVTDTEQLKMLYENSAFTIEGITEDSIPDVIEWLGANTTFTKEEPVVYITKGKVMNKNYGLTGGNAYADDLTIVSVVDIDQLKVAIPRFTIGGRWFDDIVDNNIRRERGE